MAKIKILSILLFLIASSMYAQKGFYVQKDVRIKAFQKDMIEFLLEKKELIRLASEVNIKDYSGKMGVVKCIEIYGQHSEDNILLIRFFSLNSHGDSYWGLLKSDQKYLFAYANETATLTNSMTGLDDKGAKVILEYLKAYQQWNETLSPK